MRHKIWVDDHPIHGSGDAVKGGHLGVDGEDMGGWLEVGEA